MRCTDRLVQTCGPTLLSHWLSRVISTTISKEYLGANHEKTVTTKYDVAEHLRTPKEMAAYLEASIQEASGDAAFIAKALGDIARAKGMTKVARDAGLSRERLYKAL